MLLLNYILADNVIGSSVNILGIRGAVQTNQSVLFWLNSYTSVSGIVILNNFEVLLKTFQ